jgi:hypothetical protein
VFALFSFMNDIFNSELLSILVDAVLEKEDPSESNFLVELRSFLATLTGIRNEPDLWAIFAQFEGTLGNSSQEVEYLQKELRLVQISGWESEKPLFEKVVDTVVRLTSALIKHNDVKLMKSIKLSLRRIAKVSEDSMSQLPSYTLLLQQITLLEERIEQEK